ASGRGAGASLASEASGGSVLGRKPILPGAWGGKSSACGDEKLVRQCPLLHGAGLRWEGSNGHAAQSMGEVSGAGWRFHPPRPNLCARISGDYYDGVEGEALPLADGFELRL